MTEEAGIRGTFSFDLSDRSFEASETKHLVKVLQNFAAFVDDPVAAGTSPAASDQASTDIAAVDLSVGRHLTSAADRSSSIVGPDR